MQLIYYLFKVFAFVVHFFKNYFGLTNDLAFIFGIENFNIAFVCVCFFKYSGVLKICQNPFCAIIDFISLQRSVSKQCFMGFQSVVVFQ